MKRCLPVALLFVLAAATALGQPKYRTFTQQELSQKKINVGRPLGTLVTFTDVASRFGFTYRVDEKGKTVAKASYGRYFGKLPISAFQAGPLTITIS